MSERETIYSQIVKRFEEDESLEQRDVVNMCEKAFEMCEEIVISGVEEKKYSKKDLSGVVIGADGRVRMKGISALAGGYSPDLVNTIPPLNIEDLRG